MKLLKKVTLLFFCLIFALSLMACKQNDPQDTQEEVIEESWTITQYGDVTGSQSSFYTIEDVNGNLIIIDGGWDSQAQQVRDVIAAHGNHVYAWIVSHAHPDHAGAFNAIMDDPGEIVVDDIYTIDVNFEKYQQSAQDYDGIQVHMEFMRVTENLSNVHYLNENDEVDILGLHLKVISAWDEDIESLSVNLLNNGSMMFVVEGNEESMLFCSDVENEAEPFILADHKEELGKIDYIQLGHHGNWGLTTAFYDCTNPKAVFFDAPSWLMDTTDQSYDAWMLKDYFVERGVEIYTFGENVNKIVLK